ncbi:hypothetical protein [Streptomyces sp. NPDC058964]|uniref:nSTAND1 domain-containing NTPase n=1 Tax=Streptomyces sp. NPDC058964 TaxID=3346681 RepID=UPI00367F32D3
MAGRPESPLDPTTGPVARFAAELRKLRAEAGSPTYRVMAQRAGQGTSTLSQAASGERLPTLPVVLAYVRACGGDPEEWEERWRQAAAEVAAEPRTGDEDVEPPYRGLARFEPGDANLFFGRDELTDRLVELTRVRRFTAVFGPSGSGKSSLLRAGLIPRLRNPDQATPQPAALRVLTPGEHPLRTHEQRLTPKDGDGDTWLIVDQFEELYTLCHDPAERDRFIDRLLAATEPVNQLRVIIAVRADFVGRCAEHPALTAALQDATVLAGPMSRDELREAIVKPAQAVGLIVERTLTTRILDEVEGEPGALPLMSHALLETWHRRKGRALTENAYEAAGGLHGAIAGTAELLYTRLSSDQVRLARRLLLRLVTPGQGAPDTRRPVDRSELDQVSGGDLDEILESMARARLVTVDGEHVDLAHEALLTAWPRLRSWIEEDRQRLLLHRALAQDARSWETHGRDPGALYRGVRLASAEEAFTFERSAELTALETDFLKASRAARGKERRRLRTFTASLSLLLVLALVASVAAWQQNQESGRRRSEAAARRIASLAHSLRTTDPALAMRLSVAAWRTSATTETKAALYEASTQQDRDVFPLPQHSDDDGTLLSADGRTLVIAGQGRVQRWDVVRHRRTGMFPGTRGSGGEPRYAMDLSGDARRLLVLGELLQVRDVNTGATVGNPFPVGGTVTDAGLASDGTTLIVAGGRDAQVWDIRRHRRLLSREGAEVQHALVSADGRYMAVCTTTGSLEVWDVHSKHRVAPGARAAGWNACGNSIAFGAGNLLAVTTDHGVRIWDATSRRKREISHPGAQEVTFSNDGRYLAVTGEKDLSLWRIDGPPRLVLHYTPRHEDVSEVRIDPQEGVIRYVTGTAVRTVEFDDTANTSWHQKTTQWARFSPDGQHLATARLAGSTAEFELRKTAGGPLTRLRSAHCESNNIEDRCAIHMVFSHNGRAYAYGTSTYDHASSHAWPERISIWDTRENREFSSLKLTTNDTLDLAESIALTMDGQVLLAYRPGSDQWERWDARSGGRITRRTAFRPVDETYVPSTNKQQPLALRPDGRLLATDYSMLLALPSGRSTVRRLSRDGATSELEFNPTGDRLAVGTDTGSVSLWDGDGRRHFAELAGTVNGDLSDGREAVSALAFSPDGSTLAVGGNAGTITLWDVASAQQLGSPLPTSGDPILALSFRDGRTLQAAGKHVPLRTYPIDPARITATVCERAGGGLTREQWRTYLPELRYRDMC